MPRILLTPAPNSYRKTGGLCGMWNDNTSKDLYVLDDNGDEKYNANVNEIKDFWRFVYKYYGFNLCSLNSKFYFSQIYFRQNIFNFKIKLIL